jgi:dienelactone hydrolase
MVAALREEKTMATVSTQGSTTGKGTHQYDRVPFLVMFEEKSAFKETYAGRIGWVSLEGHLLRPRESASKTVLIYMHPTGVQNYLPMPIAMAKNGWHVITIASRYPHNDSTLIMEKVAYDLGATIRHAKEKFGYEKVVLAGWSGGGSLSMFYQAEAEHPTITHTPAGEEYDLTRAKLPPADAVMQLAAHMSRHRTLTEWLDPSIADEANPHKRDVALDIYHPDGPKPPYDRAWLKDFRAAQLARNRRITAWVKQRYADFQKRGLTADEQCFVVEGTMAEPKWYDGTIDPNDRKVGTCFMGDPKVVNNTPAGLARFSSLRSWLSQWSYDDARGDGPNSGPKISVPVFQIVNTADDACTPAHADAIFNAVTHADKERHVIQGANHYYFGQPEKMQESVQAQAEWLRRKGF